MNFKIRLRFSIVTAILFMLTILSSAMIISLWHISSNAADKVAHNIFNMSTNHIQDRTQYLINHALELSSYGAILAPPKEIEGDGLKNTILPIFIATLKNKPFFYSLYYGVDDGSFFQVIPTRSNEKIIKAHSAPENTLWIVRTITQTNKQLVDGPKTQTWSFLDKNQQIISQRFEPNATYDPRKRPWYKLSKDISSPKLTSAYIFNSLQQSGITAASALPTFNGVFGVDLIVASLNDFVTKQKVSSNGGILIFDESTQILASSEKFGNLAPLTTLYAVNDPAVKAVMDKYEKAKEVAFLRTDFEQNEFLLSITEIGVSDSKIYTAIIAPSDDFGKSIRAMQNQVIYLYLAGLFIFVPLAFIFSTYLSRSANKLVEDAGRIRRIDFTDTKPVKSRILEFHNLGFSFQQMKKSLMRNNEALEVSQEKLNRLVELGIAMAAEHDSAKLMEMVLLGAKELANADGGTLYTIGNDNKLDFQILRTDSLNIKLGGSTGNKITIPSVALFDEEGKPNHKNIVSHTVHKEETVNIADAYNNDDFDFSGTKIFDKANNYHSKSFLTVPLKPRGGDIIGALQIINPLNSETGEIETFSTEIQRFVEALAAQAATALYNRDLITAQEELMDSMIKLIAGAIDTKSPYTGGHCERVPELAVLLAQKACLVDSGSLADFNFSNDDEWREFEIGAWLHDCGKVVTPEYVADKATKLETIYNRIHEIRTRFEILLRDCEIESLKATINGIEPSKIEQNFEARKESLIADFAFIAECNIGGEFLDDSKIEKIKAIGNTTWVRNFDDRIGLSQEEQKNFQEGGITPSIEKLLDDKNNHIIPRQKEISDRYEKFDFKIDIPTNLYNKGEIYNLSISRGTLTEEERFKINEHVIQTIAMLESLPFPKHLQRIPEYAGTHHETLIGTGYPRKLSKGELSVPARIMAIADIFEALTAADRPYKKIKTLSESIHILNFFKKDGHIDADLFDLFLTSGAYKDYAEKFLLPEQLDEVDISKYI